MVEEFIFMSNIAERSFVYISAIVLKGEIHVHVCEKHLYTVLDVDIFI